MLQSKKRGIVRYRGMHGCENLNIALSLKAWRFIQGFSESYLHLARFIADLVYVVFDLVFGFQACIWYE
jgi:hypothetical protein